VGKLKKKQRVEKYLNQLMKGRFFKIEDLLSLTIRDLQENTPLLDISRPTIATVLKAFKEKYKNKKIKPVPADNKSQQMKTTVGFADLHPDDADLNPDEIAKFRKMLDWFELQMEDTLATFEELKSALTDIGMDYRKLLAQYRAKK